MKRNKNLRIKWHQPATMTAMEKTPQLWLFGFEHGHAEACIQKITAQFFLCVSLELNLLQN